MNGVRFLFHIEKHISQNENRQTKTTGHQLKLKLKQSTDEQTLVEMLRRKIKMADLFGAFGPSLF